MTYKSSLVKFIVEKTHLPYISGEWSLSNCDEHTFPNLIFPLIPPVTIIEKESLRARQDEHYYEKAIETFNLITKLLQAFPKQIFLLERFHISANFFEKKYNFTITDFSEIEDILLSLNTVIVFCYREPESYYDALNIRLKENNFFGEEIYPKSKNEYLEDTNIFRKLLDNSKLKVIELNTTEGKLNSLFAELKSKIAHSYI